MTEGKRAVIFCSASSGIDPKYNQAAREIVRAACMRGYGIVSGGATRGTMGVVCDTVAECGTENIGVLPRFMEQYLYPNLTRLIWTDTMSERKTAMREGTSVALALPGGIGTMDELFETFVLAKLHKYSGRVAAFNMDGYYDTLVKLLDGFVERGMLEYEDRALISFPSTIEETIRIFE